MVENCSTRLFCSSSTWPMYQAQKWLRLPWLSNTPLGWPVVPEV